jgi:hypothetical protein
MCAGSGSGSTRCHEYSEPQSRPPSLPPMLNEVFHMEPRVFSRFCAFCTLHSKVKLPIGGGSHASDRVVSRRIEPPIGSASMGSTGTFFRKDVLFEEHTLPFQTH